MDIGYILRLLHSWNRWVLVVVVVVALVYFARGWFMNQSWTKQSKMLLSIFSGLVDLQWLLGLLLLLYMGSLTGFGIRHYWEHLVVQTIALIVAHVHAAWRKRELPDKTRHQRAFLVVVAVVVLVAIGIFSLPVGIQWRFLGA